MAPVCWVQIVSLYAKLSYPLAVVSYSANGKYSGIYLSSNCEVTRFFPEMNPSTCR